MKADPSSGDTPRAEGASHRTLVRLADAVIFGSMIVAAALLLVASLWPSEVQRLIDFPSRLRGSALTLYLVLPPALCLILLAFASRLRESLRVHLALLLVSTLAGLYAIESVLHLTTPPTLTENTLRILRAHRQGVPLDRRSKIEVIETYERRGETLVVGHSVALPGAAESESVLPLGGISRTLHLMHCNESGRYIVYRSDEHGFPNPPRLHALKRLDVVILGDSFAEGACVGHERAAAGMLRAAIPATLNLGKAGNGPLAQLAALREFAGHLRPAVVLWFYYEGNDLKDLSRELANRTLRRYLEDPDFTQDLRSRQAEVDALLWDEWRADFRREHEAKTSGFRRVRAMADREISRRRGALRWLMLDHWHDRVLRFFDRPDETPTPSHGQALERILGAARRQVDTWGGRLYFVYLPSWARFADPSAENPHREGVLELTRELQIPVVDLYPVFLDHGDPLSLFPFRLPGHYTEDAYRLLAEAVLRRLEADSALSPQAGPEVSPTSSAAGARKKSAKRRPNRRQ